jgi:c-di-GMP-binding flagellar brake protein YcgR
MVERREHERVLIRAEVVLRKGVHVERMTARDISIAGAFLETTLFDHIDLKTGSRFDLTLHVDESGPTHAVEDGHTIHAQARIVRREPGGNGHPSGIGVAFEELDDANRERILALVHRNF